MDSNTKTLYEIVGEDNISLLVDAFYKRVYSDELLIPLFTNNIDEVKDKQFCFLCQFLGGPSYYNEKYGPPKMRMRHLPHPIDNEKKDAWLRCMKSAIDTLDLEPSVSEALYNCFPKIANHMLNR